MYVTVTVSVRIESLTKCWPNLSSHNRSGTQPVKRLATGIKSQVLFPLSNTTPLTLAFVSRVSSFFPRVNNFWSLTIHILTTKTNYSQQTLHRDFSSFHCISSFRQLYNFHNTLHSATLYIPLLLPYQPMNFPLFTVPFC